MLHSLTGTAKLSLVIGLVTAAMITFDGRLLAVLTVLNLVLWGLSRIKLSDLKVILCIIGVFILLNNALIYIFAPNYGTELLGTQHILWAGHGRWMLSAEQLYYQGLVTLKYFAVLPAVLLFITTTKPPEFAASLNSIGVPYRFAYAVSLALRYIPDLQRDYQTISLAQQARGLDTSGQVPWSTRLRNLMAVLMPLLLGSLDRIEATSAALELRGFGQGKTRTWYGKRTLRARDWWTLAAAVLVVAAAIAMYFLNHGRFWNPFS